jgi:hypothetical protein
VKNAVKNNFYVDDFLFSTNCKSEAFHAVSEVRSALQNHGMDLCKIKSNDQAILDGLNPGEKLRYKDINLNPQETSSLGLTWSIINDMFLLKPP